MNNRLPSVRCAESTQFSEMPWGIELSEEFLKEMNAFWFSAAEFPAQ